MINYLKKILNNFLFDRIEYYLNQKFSIGNKWKVNIDKSSWFNLPLEITGGENIFIGQESSIGKHSWLAAYKSYLNYSGFNPRILIGNQVRIGNYACITSVNLIKIDDGVLISEYFYTSDHSHGIDACSSIPPLFQDLQMKDGGVQIGENCFIGYRVSILPGVVLGKSCVVGSHSVVTRSFPDYSMVAGVPARLIKKYDQNKKSWVSVI